MGRSLIETASGAINGTNCTFYTALPYLTGSTVVFLNGVASPKDVANGWIEVSPNKILMKIAPLTGDVVQVYYRPKC